MRSVLAWLAVNAFFAAINIVAALLIFCTFSLGTRFAPALMANPLFLIVLGALAVGAAIWLAHLALRALIARPLRGSARARA